MYLKEAQREPCCVDALCAIRVPQPRLRLQPTRPRSLRFPFVSPSFPFRSFLRDVPTLFFYLLCFILFFFFCG